MKLENKENFLLLHIFNAHIRKMHFVLENNNHICRDAVVPMYVCVCSL